jgi:hypothetical protein
MVVHEANPGWNGRGKGTRMVATQPGSMDTITIKGLTAILHRPGWQTAIHWSSPGQTVPPASKRLRKKPDSGCRPGSRRGSIGPKSEKGTAPRAAHTPAGAEQVKDPLPGSRCLTGSEIDCWSIPVLRQEMGRIRYCRNTYRRCRRANRERHAMKGRAFFRLHSLRPDRRRPDAVASSDHQISRHKKGLPWEQPETYRKTAPLHRPAGLHRADPCRTMREMCWRRQFGPAILNPDLPVFPPTMCPPAARDS